MNRIMRVVVTVIGLAVLAMPGAELGAETPKGKAKPEEKVKEMDFEGELVEAQFLRPDQSVAEALVRRKKSSLIQVRTDFVDEILKSAEDL